MSDDKFVVFCEKVPTKDWYFLWFKTNNQLSDRIKALPKGKRLWNPEKKLWEVTAAGLYNLILNYRKSDKIFFDFMGPERKQQFLELVNREVEKERQKMEDLKKQLEKNDKTIVLKEELEKNFDKYADAVLKHLKQGVSLYKHQIVAAYFLDFVGSALLSLEMGLGKTLCSIAYAEMKQYERVVVITPNSLKHNFYNEVAKFTNSKAFIVGSKKNPCKVEDAKYIIFNYEYFNPSDERDVKAKLAKIGINTKTKSKKKFTKIDLVICDESHRLKNTDSNTFLNFRRYLGHVESKVFLSGTPAPNRIAELYSVLHQISPLEFATKTSFMEYYCGIRYDPKQEMWIETPPKLEELFHKLSPHTYRKKKIDVLDLPEKTYQKILIEMTDAQKKDYQRIEKGVVDNLIFGTVFETKVNPLVVMGELRQYTAASKINSLVEIIDRMLEEDEKVVVVDMYKETLRQIHKLYPEVSRLHTGDQTVDERNEIVNDFQNPDGKCKVFLGSIQTCNYGLTLTAANKLIIITLPFSVGEYDQVSDRLHRIGQINNVTIYLLTMEGTIDEDVFNTIEMKRTQIVKAIDNIDHVTDVETSVLNDLIGSLKKKYVR